MTDKRSMNAAIDLYARKPKPPAKRLHPDGWVCASCTRGEHGARCTSLACGCERCNGKRMG